MLKGTDNPEIPTKAGVTRDWLGVSLFKARELSHPSGQDLQTVVHGGRKVPDAKTES
jgi:hypothetical protein